MVISKATPEGPAITIIKKMPLPGAALRRFLFYFIIWITFRRAIM